MQKEKVKSVLIVVSSTLLWSMGAPIAKYVESPALSLIFFRSLSGLIFLAVFMIINQKSRVFIVKPLYIFGGIFYALLTICFYLSLKFTTAANSTILANTSPFFLAILGIIFLHEKPAKRDWIVLIFIMSGMILCFYGGISLNGSVGDFLAVCAAVSFSILAVIIKKIDIRNSMQPIIWGNLLAILLTLPGFFITGSIISEDIPLFILLGIFSMAIPFILYAKAQKNLGAMEASFFKLIEPVAAPVWVGLLIGEIPSIYTMIGGTLVIISLFFNTYIKYRNM